MLSRRTLPRFALAEPESLEEALSLTEAGHGSARVLAGGIYLLAEIRRRGTAPATLVSLGRVRELHEIRAGDGFLEIGAMATLRNVESNSNVREEFGVLRQAIQSIISIQVKNVATAVGNLCVGTPASDIAAALLALDAECVIVGDAGKRNVAIGDFCLGPGETALRGGELVTSIRIPQTHPAVSGAFIKMVRTATDISKLACAVCLMVQDDICVDARIGLASVAPTPVRALSAEERLKGATLTVNSIEEASHLALEAICPINDVRSTSVYRKRMVPVLLSRAIHQAMKGRGHGNG